MSKMTERVVNDFKHAEGNSAFSHKLIDDIQADRERFSSTSNDRGWLKERDRINQQLHDAGVLPKVSLEGGRDEMRVLMLTSEKGSSHGVVLQSGEGPTRKTVVLTEDGKYVEAEKTADGYVAQKNGTEYEKGADGVLKIKERPGREPETEERKRRIDEIKKTESPDPAGAEKRMTEEDRVKKASELYKQIASGDVLRASLGLESMDLKDAIVVAKKMLELNTEDRKQRGASGVPHLYFKVVKDAFGKQHYKVGDATAEFKEAS